MKIAVFISGTGRSLRNLADHKPKLDIRLVISSNPSIKGNDVAVEHGLPLTIIPPSDIKDIYNTVSDKDIDLIVLAGWKYFLAVNKDYENKIINVHPSLLPAFGGHGYYGNKVHQAVLDAGCKVSGCTVHFVDNEYDHGPIIIQRAITVHDYDTVETLAHRVFQEECVALPTVVRLFSEGRITINGRTTRID